VAQALGSEELKERRVLLIGHADTMGTEENNTNLSERRAKSVKHYLVEKGALEPERFEVLFFGENRPRADNESAEGRTENRRVEIVVETQ
jgi:OOP family OmpA-OmpF porin